MKGSNFPDKDSTYWGGNDGSTSMPYQSDYYKEERDYGKEDWEGGENPCVMAGGEYTGSPSTNNGPGASNDADVCNHVAGGPTGWKLRVYDPIIHEEGHFRIPTEEHQVTQQANGTVEATTDPSWTSYNSYHSHHYDGHDYYDEDTIGPGSYMWHHLDGDGSNYKYSEEEWEDLPPLNAVEDQANIANPESKTFTTPYDSSALQLSEESPPAKWVELQDCTGAAGEVVLMEGLENASSATCRTATDNQVKAVGGNHTP